MDDADLFCAAWNFARTFRGTRLPKTRGGSAMDASLCASANEAPAAEVSQASTVLREKCSHLDRYERLIDHHARRISTARYRRASLGRRASLPMMSGSRLPAAINRLARLKPPGAEVGYHPDRRRSSGHGSTRIAPQWRARRRPAAQPVQVRKAAVAQAPLVAVSQSRERSPAAPLAATQFGDRRCRRFSCLGRCPPRGCCRRFARRRRVSIAHRMSNAGPADRAGPGRPHRRASDRPDSA